MDKKTKKYLIIAGIVLVILIIFGWYFYKKGKKTTTLSPIIPDDPNSTSAGNNPAGLSNASLVTLAAQAYEDMKGFNGTGHNDDIYQAILELSDTDFSRFYNTWNSKYQVDTGETFIQYLSDQYALYFSSFRTLKEAIMERAARLNFK
jgi:hypothetical protein